MIGILHTIEGLDGPGLAEGLPVLAITLSADLPFLAVSRTFVDCVRAALLELKERPE